MTRLLTAVALFSIVCQPLGAQTLEPGPAEIEPQIEAALPSWWDVAGTTLVAKINEGDAITPIWRFRAEAEATLEMPLYAEDSAAGGLPGQFEVVIETLGAGVTRRVFVVGSAAYRAGAWDIEVDIENPFADLGQPADFFDGPVLVPGTPEAEATRQRLAAAQDLASALTNQANDNEAAFRSAAQALSARLDTARADQARAVDNTLAEMQAQLASVQDDFDRAVNALRADMEAKSAAARDEIAAMADGGLEMARIEAERAALEQQAVALDALKVAQAELAEKRLAIAQDAANQAATLATAQAEALTAAAQAKQSALEALRTSLTSDDPGMRRSALAEALQSDEWVLQREALSMLIAEGPTLTLRFSAADVYDGETLPESNAFVFTAFDPSTGNFEGERRWSNGSRGMRGTIGQGGLVMQDQYCQATLVVEGTTLEGPLDCGRDKWFGLIRLY